MTPAERAVALRATTQAVLGNGLFTNKREFKAKFCRENNITDAKLTELVRKLLAGEKS